MGIHPARYAGDRKGKRQGLCKVRAGELGADSGEKFCAYILLEGISRGCDVENCDKKRTDKQMRKKKRWEDFY